ncbi:PREDICTED: myosin-binding protein 1-like [Camelina sativa]|uniref:Myosin-binding protein 1-like n=1 Tax=Camelina sativa TaxID=90675 RepID=A0ABM0WSX4_CAMSA|nr:PREDICTED: myosin-binding protein 1-like [Camelina sativa]XP_010475695.1 PREDICTED: myosin-binding protein 1-like [Camelina sativa]XP_010475696.1 PREDICTED: myosin-binding protein 1-like [Camelina sativa]XP_010475697.1 PREDICTED: myosin-binding protein 1-like [Camelina sativa]
MATRQMSQMGSRSFTRALALAFNEWLLMLMLFVNSIFSYVIARFADYSELQSPCLMCSNLDHILGRTKHSKKPHWDMICSKHKSEISSLVYCHAHGKLVDVRGMCETCLFSFATTNKSNAETYRLLVGKLGDNSYFGSKTGRSTNPNCSKLTDCTCCNQLWGTQTAAATQVAEREMLPKFGLLSKVRTGKQSTPKKSVRFNHLPDVGYSELKIHSDTESEAVFPDTEPKQESLLSHMPHFGFNDPKIGLVGVLRTEEQSTPKKSVSFNHLPDVGYSELKIHSDTESEAVFSEDEGVIVKEEGHKFHTVGLQIPPIITLPYDLATDKLLNLDFHLEPLTTQNDQEEVQLQEINWRTYSSFPEFIPVDGVPETPEKVLKEEEIISSDDLFLTSRAIEHFAAVSKDKEEPIRLHDITLTPDFMELPENTSVMEETELLCLNDVTSTSKGNEEPIHVQDISLTPEFKENPANASVMEETELICLNDVTSTSRTMEHSAAVLKENEEPIHLQDTTLTSDFMENSANASLMDETELICLNDVTSTSHTMEYSAAVLKEKEEPSHLQDISLTPDLKENPANISLTEETELICLNDVTSTSKVAETPEDVFKGIELMPLHDVSLDDVPESLTTNETSVEISKEKDTVEADITSLESEYIVVPSPNSMPETSIENCVSDSKEMQETSLTGSLLSEMAPRNVASHTQAAINESESSSFNSMSVAAETNQYSGELLDLADAYNIVVGNESNNDSNGREQIENWMKKDTSRVTEDLKALLTQISASRGIEFLSPRDVSPKISVNSSDQDTKNIDHDMQLLIQKRMLERNESNLSLEGVSVGEIEGESESDRLKRQVDYDRKLLTGLYKELEEERSASAVATNQAMAMITRLQEEKASFQMEALQNLRMMEEQAEYDMEAIQRLNDLLVEREKLIQDLEAEIEYFRDQTPQKKDKLDVAEKVTEMDSPSEGMSNKIQSCLVGFDEERLYITSCLEKIENRVTGEAHGHNIPAEDSVSELQERVERLKGDLYFLEQVMNSLGHGNEGMQFVKEIASHLQTLRTLSMKRQEHTES